MPISFPVTNEPPDTDEGVPQGLRALFETYTKAVEGRSYPIFKHQASVFRKVATNEQVLLVAGTAAGKTLAIAIPLFYKLATAQIRKVLLMYPTIALMEDQRRVMERLAGITNQEVGQLQGGMNRSSLIGALNKAVILATPDEIYWFFRRNVKYSGLLIYGLCQVDEFVLDEAHLFNGLMLRNVEHLWQRVKTLAECLGKTPRLHILTATPTKELERLSSEEPIVGKSKCDNVQMELRTSGWRDRAEQFANAVSEALESESRKVLVVCNSARMAHQLFEKYKVEDTSAIPLKHRLSFGKVKLGDLTGFLVKAGVREELIDELSERLLREEDVVLADIPNGVEVMLVLQQVVAHITEVLEGQSWQVKRAVREQCQLPGESWESILKNRPLPCRIVAIVRSRLLQTQDPENRQAIVDEWLADTAEKLSNIADDPIRCEANGFEGLTDALVAAGLDRELASLLTKRLTYDMKAKPAQLPVRGLSHRPIYLRWLPVDKDKADKIREAVRVGLQSGELDAECRHIGLWKGTDVPVIVYSGSMAKQAREGLINVFADLDRAVLISTSAVEVGVDFHADVLITEECEGNSFLQRFGRVGRHGREGNAIAFVGGDVYGKLHELDEADISREEFSTKIADAFPRRNYASASPLVDAGHYLVNQQLGRVGGRLNDMSKLAGAKPLAQELRTANIQLGFGLRSTMPQIVLRDGVAKDPFYLLRYLNDDALRPADSPFEVARAKTWFTSLIFQRARFDVIVDLEETLRASEHLFILHDGKPNIISSRGIGLQHVTKLAENIVWSEKEPLFHVLLHGDVYLSRLDRGLEMPFDEPVKDAEGNPLFIPNQSYLVMWRWTDDEQIRELLKGARVVDWEELHYDWDRLKQTRDPKAMVIVENTAGACFAAYRELVNYAHRQIQR